MAALPLIVFDVNETLLDLGTMEPTFERIFGDKSAMRLWFANLILYSVALTVASVMTANSSPPQRATVSCGGTAARSLRPTCASSTSPAPWPTAAFTAAK